MGLKINIDDIENDFSDVERYYDEGNVTFELSLPDTDESVLFPFPFPVGKKQIPDKNTSKVFIFKNKHFRANDLIEFRVDNKIAIKDDGLIGYFFNIQLLLQESGLETFEQAKYSIIYALTGIEVILENKSNSVSLSPKTVNQKDILNLDISYLYDEDVIILVIDKNLLKNPDEFNIDQYLCGLYKYGFYLLTAHETEINYNQLDIIENDFNRARKQKFPRIEASSYSIDFHYYRVLLHQLIIQKSEFMTSFITLYQVIELLKDNVLHNEMKALKVYKTGHEMKQKIEGLSDTVPLTKKLFGSDYSKLNQQIVEDLTKDLIAFFDEINTSAKKETDITHLIGDLKGILDKHQGHPKSKGRKSLHDDILNKLKLEEKTNRESFAKLFNQFRNTIVHNYSKVIQEGVDDKLLNDIQMRFEYLIIELIRTYHIKPAKT